MQLVQRNPNGRSVFPSSIIKPTDPTAHLVSSTILARFCLHFWVARIHAYIYTYYIHIIHIYIILSHFCWVKPWLKPWLPSYHLSTRPALRGTLRRWTRRRRIRSHACGVTPKSCVVTGSCCWWLWTMAHIYMVYGDLPWFIKIVIFHG